MILYDNYDQTKVTKRRLVSDDEDYSESPEGSAFFLMTIIELEPDSPIMSEHWKVVPRSQVDLRVGSDQSWPCSTIQSKKLILQIIFKENIYTFLNNQHKKFPFLLIIKLYFHNVPWQPSFVWKFLIILYFINLNTNYNAGFRRYL